MTTAAPAHITAPARTAASSARIFLLIGPPGCGKGTQSKRISEWFDIPCVSTGEILRAAASSGGTLGRRVREVMGSGGLVDDDLVNDVVAHRIGEPDCARGFILDGYPRNVCQAEFLAEVLTARGYSSPEVIVFDVHPDALVSRLEARRYCPVCARIYNLVSAPPAEAEFCDDDGMFLVRRPDDYADVIHERFRSYEHSTAPLLRHYGLNRILRIDAGQECEAVSYQIESALSRSEL